MDELGGFEPTDTTGFIQIESIRIRKSVSLLSLCVRYNPTTILIDGHKPISARVKLV